MKFAEARHSNTPASIALPAEVEYWMVHQKNMMPQKNDSYKNHLYNIPKLDMQQAFA